VESAKGRPFAGRRPRATSDGPTVRTTCNAFLTAKQHRVDTGELSPLRFKDYFATCSNIVEEFGKERPLDHLRPEDFQKLRTTLAKTRGPVALGNAIQRVRSVFLYAYKNDLTDRPVKFGSEFTKPSKKATRIHQANRGRQTLERSEVLALIKAASPQLAAMLLLGINCGYGNSDVGNLTVSALDIAKGWVTFPRPKTGTERRCALWPETIKALNEVLANRREPKDAAHRDLVFLTKYGAPWSKTTYQNPVAQETVKLLRTIGVNQRGWGFYRLRHTFRKVADEVHDQPAIDFIMGHARDDMPSNYRHGISDERLRAVTDHVHKFLYPKTKRKAK
jgi:integrase